MKFEAVYQIIHPIQGWFSYQQAKILFPYIFNLDSRSLLVEIGTYHGKSTKFFSLANPYVRILTIDLGRFPEKPDNVGTCIDEDILRSGRIFQVRGDSCEVVKGFNWKIDFLFIDGDHSYEAVRKDIDNWLPRLKSGHYVAFHDYEETHNGVIKAVDETKGIKKMICKDGICLCLKR